MMHSASTPAGFGPASKIVTAGAVAAFPAAWWFLGLADKSGAWIADPDYLITPPRVDPAFTGAIGTVSVLLVFSALMLIKWMILSRRWSVYAAGVFVPAVIGFAYTGMAAHVATAPVVGANIGAGLVMMAGLPLASLSS